MTAAQLVLTWRQRATELQPYAAAAAIAFTKAAEELEYSLAETSQTVLTLEEAHKESGFSIDHLRRQIRQGKIPNAGRTNAPRIRREELPKKAGHVPRLTSNDNGAPSAVQIARSVVHSLNPVRAR